MANGNGNGRNGRGAPAAPVAVIPFPAAAHEHVELAFDKTVTPGANEQQFASLEVPAFGYLRHIWLEVEATGGSLGTGAVTEDYPWNLFSSIVLHDVNGAPIYGPLPGYSTLWANIIGGYRGAVCDPRAAIDFDGASANPKFAFRIPVEISHRDAFGSLANQNAAAAYKVSLTVGRQADLVTEGGATPSTAASFRIRGWLESWSLPNERDMAGRPQMQLPPRHGTTQYWSRFLRDTSAGANTVPLPRVGNLIRNIVIIARDAGGARADGVFPDPAELVWDARSLTRDSQSYRHELLASRIPDLIARDAGVFVYGFAHSDHNHQGDDAPTLWLPTVQSSRLELTGNSDLAGRLEVLTNDIAPVEVTPGERYIETSETGFHPQVGVAPTAGR